MSDDVDVFVSARLDREEIAELEADLRHWGVAPHVRRMPTMRGTELTWLLLLTIPAEIIVKTLLEQLGVQVVHSLRGVVQRVLKRSRADDAGPAEQPEKVVVIESPETGAQFALDADLPIDAYQQMFETLTDVVASDGLRTFDRGRRCWVPAGG
jgi:hypothetical protein